MTQGDFIREDDVYQAWKRQLERLDPVDLVAELRKHARLAGLYERLVSPGTEPNLGIAEGLRRLNRWGAQTIYPFLLNLYREYDEGRVSAEQFADVLRVVESFLVRRLLTGVPTNALNRIFLRLWQQRPAGLDVVEATRVVLSDPGRRWPTDREIRDGVRRTPVYLNGRTDQRRLVLETLELSFGHKESVVLSGLTIEHIMPQSMTPSWQTMLGPHAEEVHETLLHTLGNVTLTAYNPELSNASFERKRQILAESHLDLNREVADEETWTAEQILGRAERLAQRAIQIWPGPIERSDSAPPEMADERDLIRYVLTRIPLHSGQLKLFAVLRDAGDNGTTNVAICERTSWTPHELAGVLGALGKRINASIVAEAGEKPGISLLFGWERLADGAWRYWLQRPFRELLQEMRLIDHLHE